MILKTIVSSSLEKSQVELIFHPAIKNLFNYLFQLVSSAIMKNMRTTSFCHRNWSQFRKLCIWDLLCSRLQLLQAFVGNDDNTHKRVETQGEITCWTLGSLTIVCNNTSTWYETACNLLFLRATIKLKEDSFFQRFESSWW